MHQIVVISVVIKKLQVSSDLPPMRFAKFRDSEVLFEVGEVYVSHNVDAEAIENLSAFNGTQHHMLGTKALLSTSKQH